ncbi:hypothetical protein P171DRAFT_200493 [Karstenula rhodostoma CBS 690.94]|uniref:Uncharacterized protein n=1 Tax=Karstenula rhodostoma CBS 690.94 TaxID=1392251 RepID=A0A9P4PV78_9PLEO|nr:hypothetical protein P171DRAFT_200493 [Karstenula rhodostoma CBS 690.94]
MHRFFTTLSIFLALAMFAKAFPVASPELVEVNVPRECDEGDKVLKRSKYDVIIGSFNLFQIAAPCYGFKKN